jgi:hypothetical protein
MFYYCISFNELVLSEKKQLWGLKVTPTVTKTFKSVIFNLWVAKLKYYNVMYFVK